MQKAARTRPDGARALLSCARGDAGCHTMNASLAALSSHKISVEDARNATTDRIGFADMV